MISSAALQRRITSLEASRLPFQRRAVRTHIVDCLPAKRPARIAAIEAAEPSAFHIIHIIVEPGEAAASVQ